MPFTVCDVPGDSSTARLVAKLRGAFECTATPDPERASTPAPPGVNSLCPLLDETVRAALSGYALDEAADWKRYGSSMPTPLQAIDNTPHAFVSVLVTRALRPKPRRLLARRVRTDCHLLGSFARQSNPQPRGVALLDGVPVRVCGGGDLRDA